MSYDLAVWDGDRPLDNHQAGSTYEALYQRYLESDDGVVPPAPRITAYVEALVARYPDDIDRSVVWASPPVISEASGPIVYLLMAYGTADEVSEYAATLAGEHGLICFDPTGRVPPAMSCCFSGRTRGRRPRRGDRPGSAARAYAS